MAAAATNPELDISWPVERPAERQQWDPTYNHSNGHSHDRPLTPPSQTYVYSTPHPSILPGGRHSLATISRLSNILGLVLGLSISLTLYSVAHGSPLWRPPFFLATLCVFHFLEFYITAYYNSRFATPGAFLLSHNGSAYNIAHGLAFFETTLFHSAWAPFTYGTGPLAQSLKSYVLALGFVMLAVGQLTRSLAMAQAGTNFNHRVQTQKAHGHQLVTDGVYAVLRHPSYFGFFWWGVGSQLVLGNGVCLIGYALVLWKFFSSRIERESS